MYARACHVLSSYHQLPSLAQEILRHNEGCVCGVGWHCVIFWQQGPLYLHTRAHVSTTSHHHHNTSRADEARVCVRVCFSLSLTLCVLYYKNHNRRFFLKNISPILFCSKIKN